MIRFRIAYQFEFPISCRKLHKAATTATATQGESFTERRESKQRRLHTRQKPAAADNARLSLTTILRPSARDCAQCAAPASARGLRQDPSNRSRSAEGSLLAIGERWFQASQPSSFARAVCILLFPHISIPEDRVPARARTSRFHVERCWCNTHALGRRPPATATHRPPTPIRTLITHYPAQPTTTLNDGPPIHAHALILGLAWTGPLAPSPATSPPSPPPTHSP